MRNYNDMRNANTIGADKYFHCKANCEAASRGSVGDQTACLLSDAREWVDQNIKGDPASASALDQAANTFGRSHA
ncbi:MAG: serum amyloid a protein, partial [Anaerolineales bacterium]